MNELYQDFVTVYLAKDPMKIVDYLDVNRCEVLIERTLRKINELKTTPHLSRGQKDVIIDKILVILKNDRLRDIHLLALATIKTVGGKRANAIYGLLQPSVIVEPTCLERLVSV